MIATETRKKPIPGPIGLTDEWHAERLKRIGSSEAAKAVGLSEWGTPLDLWAEKRGEKALFSGNEHTRRGRRYEPLIAEDWQEATGIKLQVYPAPLFIHPDHEWMSATPDGIISDDEGLEIKCPTFRQAHKFGDEGTDFLPPDYVIQAQHQMAVMGWQRVHFAILFDISEFPKQYIVERNDALIDGMISAERELWERIQNNDPPEPDWEHPRTPQLIKELYHLRSGAATVLDNAAHVSWLRQRDLAAQIKTLEEEREIERAKVIAALGDAEIGMFSGETFEVYMLPVKESTYTATRKAHYQLRERKLKVKR